MGSQKFEGIVSLVLRREWGNGGLFLGVIGTTIGIHSPFPTKLGECFPHRPS